MGDPVDITEGNTFERYDDFALKDSLGPTSFTRFYISNGRGWTENVYYNIANTYAPYGRVANYGIRWYHNFFSLVMYNRGSGDIWVRDRTGSLLKFVTSTPPLPSVPQWIPSQNGFKSLRDRLYWDGQQFILFQEDGVNLEFGAKFYAPGRFLADPTSGMWFLTAVKNVSGATTASVQYALPAGLACPVGDSAPDATPGAPYISTVTGSDGQQIVFHYELLLNQGIASDGGFTVLDAGSGVTVYPDGGFSLGGLLEADGGFTGADAGLANSYNTPMCVISAIGVQTPPEGETPVAVYSYQTVDGGQVGGLLAEAALMDKAINYSNPPNEFIASINGTPITHHYYSDQNGASVTRSNAGVENLSFQPFAPTTGDAPGSSYTTPDDLTIVTDNYAQIGDGVTNAVTSVRYMMWLVSQFPQYDEGRFYWLTLDAGASAAGWMSFVAPQNEWITTPAGYLTPAAYLDAAGNWTHFTYADPGTGAAQGTTSFPQWSELQTISYGATDIDGGTPLLAVSNTYTYGSMAQQMKQSESTPSVLGSGTATNLYTYDSTNRLSSIIRHGWTSVYDRTSTWNTVERYVGTFYFTNHACLGDANDAMGRTLEVHGPCLVDSPTSTDCNGSGIVPITQYYYYPGSPADGGFAYESNKLSRIRRYSTNAGTSCADGAYVETTLDSYDSLGNVTALTDPSGTQFRYHYGSGDHLTQMIVTVAGADQVTNFGYDNGELSFVQYPEGNYEVFCRRSTASAGCSGTWTGSIQWIEKSAVSNGSTWSEKLQYDYWPDGTTKTVTARGSCTSSCTNSSGEVRRTEHFGANALRQPTYLKLGDTLSTTYRGIVQYAGSGLPTAVGMPYNNPPDFCGSAGAVSAACTALTRDRMGRIAAVGQTPSSTAQFTLLGYDGQSNLSSVQMGCASTGTCTQPEALYSYDDFGNIVATTLPWTDDNGGDGLAGVVKSEYDAAGNKIIAMTPYLDIAMYRVFFYDNLSRLTSEGIDQGTEGDGPNILFSYFYGDSTTDAAPSLCPVRKADKGRLLHVSNPFVGDTWYQYDELGRLTAQSEIGSFAYTGATNCDASQTTTTTYSYTANGSVAAIRYPFGRTVSYDYGSGADADRVASVDVSTYNGSSWSTVSGVFSNIAWEPYGGLRAYQMHHAAGADSSVEYALGDDSTVFQNAPVPCPRTFPSSSSSDHTGVVRALWVSPHALSLGGGDGGLLQDVYTYRGGLLTQDDRCLPGAATARTQQYSYDRLARLTNAADNGFPVTGGSFYLRQYQYDSRSNRISENDDGWHLQSTYASAPYVDRLLAWYLDGGATGCGGTGCIDAVGFGYSPNGPVTSRSSAAPMVDNWDGNPVGVNVGGAQYDYVADAFKRRVSKEYPTGIVDQYFYDRNNRMVVDIGNATLQTGGPFPIDDYVWLDGRPLAMVRGQLNSDQSRASDSTASCSRLGDGAACGLYFVITDPIGKPVLMLDGSQRVTGVGDYDPFGRLNRPMEHNETKHPYGIAGGDTIVGTGFLEGTGSPLLQVAMRAHFDVVDTETAAGPVDYGYIVNFGGTTVATNIGGSGPTWTNWFAATGADGGAPSFTLKFHQDSQNCCPTSAGLDCTTACGSPPNWPYQGLAMDSYEYERYQPGATPLFTPLRFPGQYYDAESDLILNWNRLYDPLVGRYLGPEPFWQTPYPALAEAYEGIQWPVYGYAANDPVNFVDSTGFGPRATLHAATTFLTGVATRNADMIQGALQEAGIEEEAAMAQTRQILNAFSVANQVVGRCESTAQTIQRVFQQAGVQSTIRDIGVKGASDYLRWVDPQTGAVKLVSTGAFHQVVESGDMIYDAFTGPEGMQVQQYLTHLVTDPGSSVIFK